MQAYLFALLWACWLACIPNNLNISKNSLFPLFCCCCCCWELLFPLSCCCCCESFSSSSFSPFLLLLFCCCDMVEYRSEETRGEKEEKEVDDNVLGCQSMQELFVCSLFYVSIKLVAHEAICWHVFCLFKRTSLVQSPPSALFFFFFFHIVLPAIYLL